MASSKVSALKQENEQLREEVELWKKKLFNVGGLTASLPTPVQCNAPGNEPAIKKAATTPAAGEVPEKKETKTKVQEKKPKKEGNASVSLYFSIKTFI